MSYGRLARRQANASKWRGQEDSSPSHATARAQGDYGSSLGCSAAKSEGLRAENIRLGPVARWSGTVGVSDGTADQSWRLLAGKNPIPRPAGGCLRADSTAEKMWGRAGSRQRGEPLFARETGSQNQNQRTRDSTVTTRRVRPPSTPAIPGVMQHKPGLLREKKKSWLRWQRSRRPGPLVPVASTRPHTEMMLRRRPAPSPKLRNGEDPVDLKALTDHAADGPLQIVMPMEE